MPYVLQQFDNPEYTGEPLATEHYATFPEVAEAMATKTGHWGWAPCGSPFTVELRQYGEWVSAETFPTLFGAAMYAAASGWIQFGLFSMGIVRIVDCAGVVVDSRYAK